MLALSASCIFDANVMKFLSKRGEWAEAEAAYESKGKIRQKGITRFHVGAAAKSKRNKKLHLKLK